MTDYWDDNPTEGLHDPAKHATNEEKRDAFEWLRVQALGNPEEHSVHCAAVLMYELARLNDAEIKRQSQRLRERLDAVEPLPEKWRQEKAHAMLQCDPGPGVSSQCDYADELEAALQGEGR